MTFEKSECYKYYFIPKEVNVLCKIDFIKYLFNRPVFRGRLMKWAIKLNIFAFNYDPLRAMKVHVIADFLAEHLMMKIDDHWTEVKAFIHLKPLILAFDRSKTGSGASVKVIVTGVFLFELFLPIFEIFFFSFLLD